MQRHVDQVIAEHRIAPQSMLQPEGAVQQRVILLRGAEVEPDAPQTVQRLQVGPRDVHVVVPEQRAVQRGQVGDQGAGD